MSVIPSCFWTRNVSPGAKRLLALVPCGIWAFCSCQRQKLQHPIRVFGFQPCHNFRRSRVHESTERRSHQSDELIQVRYLPITGARGSQLRTGCECGTLRFRRSPGIFSFQTWSQALLLGRAKYLDPRTCSEKVTTQNNGLRT